jgi:hypothetical protein
VYYLICVGGVLLVQLAISYAVILAGTGNGSFVGLGAMLFALFGLPLTAIMVFILLRSQRQNPKPIHRVWLGISASALPLLQLLLLIAQKTFDL